MSYDEDDSPRREHRRPVARVGGSDTMRIVLWVAVVALFLVSIFAIAVVTGMINIGPQRTAAVSPPPPAQAVRPPPQGGAPASGQRPAPAPQPRITKRETYGDWIFLCDESPRSGRERCSLVQSIANAQTRAVLFVWSIRQNRDGSLTSIWQTPNEVILSAGISLDLGAPEPLVIPYQSCAGGQCRAVVELNDAFSRLLTSSEKAVATLVAPNEQKINLELSVNGLADGLAALRAHPVPPPEAPASAPATPAAN